MNKAVSCGIKLTLASCLLIGSQAMAADGFSAMLSDSSWDGKTVPEGQQCQKFGGNNPSTPALKVEGIPANTNMLIMEFSDRDNERMDNGGHGKIALGLNAPMTAASVASVSGHSFDLPAGYLTVSPHLNPKWDIAGAYMPPCSGGKGHAYYVTVKAVQFDGEKATELATSVVEMGKY